MSIRSRCIRRRGLVGCITVTDDLELTPVANVAFTGIVAEEINRLNRELKEANAEIERLRRWQDWGLHVFVCHIKGKTCWHCVSPDNQDVAIKNGSAEIIKKETRQNGVPVD